MESFPFAPSTNVGKNRALINELLVDENFAEEHSVDDRYHNDDDNENDNDDFEYNNDKYMVEDINEENRY